VNCHHFSIKCSPNLTYSVFEELYLKCLLVVVCNVVTLLTALVTAVGDAVEQMICHFSAAENQAHCSMLGDSSHTPACAHLVLSTLCPALYAVLSDGLRPTLDTAFGSIQNSVWQVVEASAQQGQICEISS
jgi:hypothetical protein